MVSTQPLAYLQTLDQVWDQVDPTKSFKEGWRTVVWLPITHYNHVKVSFDQKSRDIQCEPLLTRVPSSVICTATITTCTCI